jgi:hypothetical protein
LSAVKGQPAIAVSEDLLNDLPAQRLAITSIGDTLKDSLKVPRLVSLSIHDGDGELLWLSENLLGPDEHNVILDAIEELRASAKLTHVQRDMGDGRQATLLAARTAAGVFGALVMAMSMSLWKPPRGARGLIGDDAKASLQRIAEIALMSKPQEPAPVAEPAFELTLEPEPDVSEARPERRAAAPVAPAASAASAAAIAPPTLAAASRTTASRRSPVAAALAAGVHFHLAREPLSRLYTASEPGLVRVRGRSARNDDTDLAVSPASDRIVVGELIRLLDRESAANAAPLDQHVLRLSEQSVQDPGFLRFTAMRLQQAPQVAGSVGFAVEESLLIKHPVALGGFFEGCESLGCFVVVEGFTLHAESLPIIATKALRAISFHLPSDRRDGKPSPAARAYAVAMTFFCKAMKVECIAQTGRPDANRRWLARIGAAYVE